MQGWRTEAQIGRSKASAGLLAMQHWQGCSSRVAWSRWVQACQAAAAAGERAAGHHKTASRCATLWRVFGIIHIVDPIQRLYPDCANTFGL